MSSGKYFVLGLIVAFGSLGNVLMSRGMKQVGAITLANWNHAILALLNPWVAAGTVLLIGFMATYMTALSWADLTYVLPATSLGYVVVALLGEFVLGEQIGGQRWVGILLVTAGVGFVAGGPAVTPRREHQALDEERKEE